MPAEPLAEITAGQRREQPPEVDAHVENGERRVTTWVIGAVQAAHDARDVRLEEAVATDQEPERKVEDLQVLHGHREMTERHQHAAQDHGSAKTEQAIGEQPADHRRGVHERGVATVNRVRRLVPEEQRLREVQDEQRLHAVEAEALPSFGEKQIGEHPRMPGDRFGRVGQGAPTTFEFSGGQDRGSAADGESPPEQGARRPR